MNTLQINNSFEPYFAERGKEHEPAKTAPSQPELRQAMKELLQKRGSEKATRMPVFPK